MPRLYQKAWEDTVSIVRPNPESAPGRDLFSLLLDVSDWLGAAPNICSSLQGKAMYAIYPSAVFPPEDFFDYFGQSIASIGKTWPVCGFGMADNQETVCLSAKENGDKIQLMQQNISGKSADVLTTLCLRIDVASREISERLSRLFLGINWRTGITALNWEEGPFLEEQGLALAAESRGMFCYGGLDPQAPERDCLFSLRFPQKTALWQAFLRDGFQPIEFEWLADEIEENTLLDRIEWELALEEVMDQMKFRLVSGEKTFSLFDGGGNKLYFGADCHSAAQRALVKLLFPLND